MTTAGISGQADAFLTWRDHELAHGGMRGCIAVRTTTQTIITAEWTPIEFNATDLSDPLGFHDPAVNPSRFTIPAGWTGTYLLVGHSGLLTSGGTRLIVGWGVNGATPQDDAAVDQAVGTAKAAESVYIKELATGDYVEFMLYQDSGINRSTLANSTGAIYYLGEVA